MFGAPRRLIGLAVIHENESQMEEGCYQCSEKENSKGIFFFKRNCVEHILITFINYVK